MLYYINYYVESNYCLNYISILFTGFTLLDKLFLEPLQSLGSKV